MMIINEYGHQTNAFISIWCFYDHIILVRDNLQMQIQKSLGLTILMTVCHLKFRTRTTRTNNRTVHEGGFALRARRCVITLHILPFTGSSARSEEIGLGSSPSNSWLISPSSPSLLDEALTVNLWLMVLMRRSCWNSQMQMLAIGHLQRRTDSLNR